MVIVTRGPGQTLQSERMFDHKPRISQLRLAKALGINRTTLSFYETDSSTPPEGWDDFSKKYRAALAAELRKARAK